MNRKPLFIIALLVAVLCLLSSPAMGKCQKIRMVEKSCIEDLTECGGYEACEICEFEGTPNASVTSYFNYSEWTLLGNAVGGPVAAFYETNQGEIWVDAVAMIHLAGLDFDSGLVASGFIYGGTGKYEGATGWVAGAGVPQKGTLISWHGEICWPDED
jgi:hypothetical protein